MKIEKNIPIPAGFKRSIIAPEILSTIDKMKINDSFVIPSKRRGYAQTLAKGRGMKLAVRYIEDQAGMVRAWRVK